MDIDLEAGGGIYRFDFDVFNNNGRGRTFIFLIQGAKSCKYWSKPMSTFREDLMEEYRQSLAGEKKCSDIIFYFDAFRNCPVIRSNVSYRMEYKDGHGFQELFGNHTKGYSTYRNVNVLQGTVKVVEYLKGRK